jgi:hypothetical protein
VTPEEKIEGSLAGQKFSVTTGNLVTVLLVIVIGGAGYFQMVVQARNLAAAIMILREEHTQLRQDVESLAVAMRVLDWNQGRAPSERLPLDIERSPRPRVTPSP